MTMPDLTKFQGYTDVLSDTLAGMQDYWYVAEGPEITVDATGIITLTAGLHNLTGTGSIHTINGAQRNGQFAMLRIGSSGIQFTSGGNVRAASGLRTINRWLKLLFRDDYWEEQTLAIGDFSGGVLSFNGRIGTVLPISGDYTASLVTATDPTGSGGVTAQAVLNNLNTKIGTVAPSGLVVSFKGRQNVVVPISGDYPSTLVPITPFTVGAVTIPGPSLQEALVQIMTAIGGVAPGGVLSFKGRTGVVVPADADYPASQITATDPTALGGTRVQTVLNNLMTKITAAGGATGVQSITTQGQVVQLGSASWPHFTAQWTDYPAEFIYYNGAAALNSLFHSKNTAAEALNVIPNGLMSIYADNVMQGSLIGQSSVQFNSGFGVAGPAGFTSTVDFTGAVTFTGSVTYPYMVRFGAQQGPINLSAAVGVTATGQFSYSPPAGYGLMGFLISGDSSTVNKIVHWDFGGGVSLSNIGPSGTQTTSLYAWPLLAKV